MKHSFGRHAQTLQIYSTENSEEPFILLQNTKAQGFINLNFEQSVVTSIDGTYLGFQYGNATVPGWTIYSGWGGPNYDGGTTLPYNNEPLDSAGFGLCGTGYFRPVIEGNFSLFMKSGRRPDGTQYGASIGQTAQIPVWANSLTFRGSEIFNLQMTFNGQVIPYTASRTLSNYTVYSADISSYSGQTGLFLLSVPSSGGHGIVDNIKFYTAAVPEPAVSWLIFLSVPAFLYCRRKKSH